MHSALLSLVIAAGPAVVTVDSTFTGYEEELSSAARSDLGKKGWNDCGYAGVTETPVVTFKVPQPIEGLEFSANVDTVVLEDGGKHGCVRAGKKTVFAGAGSRAIFFIDRAGAGGAKATVRLFSRAQAAQRVEQALTTVLALALDGKGPNPRYGRIGAANPVDPAEAGVTCADRKLRPLARLEVTESSTFLLETNPGFELYVRTAEGKCLERAQLERIELTAGTHTVWAEARDRNPRDTKDEELAVTDTERAYVFDEAPRTRLGSLPVLVRTKSSDEKGWVPPSLCLKGHGGEDGYGCKGGRRAPSFLLSLEAPLEELFVDTRLGHDVTLRFAGPGVPACEISHNTRTCDAGMARIPKPKAGELAVWVQAAGPEQDVLVAFKGRDEVSRLSRTETGTDALSVQDRVVAWHFPFWEREARLSSDDRHDTLSLFAAAPAGLFVFVKKPVGETQITEPLLVQRVDKGKAGLVSLTGAEFSVRLDLVGTDVPAELTFPELPAFKPAKTVDEAMGLAGPDEQKLVTAYLEKEREHNGCVGGWMAKNDPTWGKSYELVNVRTGRTLSQTLFKKADAVCGIAKLDKASSAFVVAINAAQKKLRTTISAGLRKKLKP